jgi:hypothetical protein
MMRLIEQPAGTGELFEQGRLRGTVHYALNVYQQYDEGHDEAVAGVQHIEGRLTPSGPIEISDVWNRDAELELRLSDGRTLTLQLRDAHGNVTVNGHLTAV